MLTGAGVTLARLVDCVGARLRQIRRSRRRTRLGSCSFSSSRRNAKQLSANDIIKFFRFTFTFDRTAITFGCAPAFLLDENDILTRRKNTRLCPAPSLYCWYVWSGSLIHSVIAPTSRSILGGPARHGLQQFPLCRCCLSKGAPKEK